MATVTKIGPADHGRRMSYDEFMAGDYEPGHTYEIIDGRLHVSPEANVPENWVEIWLLGKVLNYSLRHAEVINFATNTARVFLPGRRKMTAPEPDLAA